VWILVGFLSLRSTAPMGARFYTCASDFNRVDPLMGFAPCAVKGAALQVVAPPRCARSPQKSCANFPTLDRATPTLAGRQVALRNPHHWRDGP
jgi:hypothetical protein